MDTCRWVTSQITESEDNYIAADMSNESAMSIERLCSCTAKGFAGIHLSLQRSGGVVRGGLSTEHCAAMLSA